MRLAETLLAASSAAIASTAAATVPAGTTRFLFGGSTDQVQNGAPDAAGLFIISGTTATAVDLVSYEGSVATAQITGITGTSPFVEGTGIASGEINTGTNLSIQRFTNAKDTQNNNADFALRAPTPGAASPSI